MAMRRGQYVIALYVCRSRQGIDQKNDDEDDEPYARSGQQLIEHDFLAEHDRIGSTSAGSPRTIMECTASPHTAPPSGPAGAPHACAPLALQRFVCDDVDALAESMSGWSLQMDQLAPGPFQGTVDHLRLAGVHLIRERVNRALLKHGTIARDKTSFSIPLETIGAGYCGGTALGDGMLLVSTGPTLPELRTPDRHDIAVVTVPTAALRELASLNEDDACPALSNETGLIRLGARRYEALKTFLRASFDAAEAAEAAGHAPAPAAAQAGKTLHDALLLELADLVVAATDTVPLDPTARRRVVDRVRDLVSAKPDVPLTVLDVCRAVGTSRRKLQYCFEEILGTHPAYYLRVLRLNAVRRELRRHSPATASVGDVAYRWGFPHLSRFANHYRHLFGELPSDTLKRPPR